MEAEIVDVRELFDLTGWTYLFTFGYSLDVYGYGSSRVGIERSNGHVLITYMSKIKEG